MTYDLFVYGSLRPGQRNFHHLSEAVAAVQPLQVPGRMLLRPEGYPALQLAPDLSQQLGTPFDWSLPALESRPSLHPQRVEGELLKLFPSPALAQHLDRFEGFDGVSNEYLRVACAWQQHRFWTYVAPPAADWPQIDCWPPAGLKFGDWR